MPFVGIRTIFRLCKKPAEKKNIGKNMSNIPMIFIELERLIIIP